MQKALSIHRRQSCCTNVMRKITTKREHKKWGDHVVEGNRRFDGQRSCARQLRSRRRHFIYTDANSNTNSSADANSSADTDTDTDANAHTNASGNAGRVSQPAATHHDGPSGDRHIGRCS